MGGVYEGAESRRARGLILAIDTKAKRASVQAYTLGLMRPPPDGTIDAGDRATLTWLYSGLSYFNPAAGGARRPKFTFRMGFRM